MTAETFHWLRLCISVGLVNIMLRGWGREEQKRVKSSYIGTILAKRVCDEYTANVDILGIASIAGKTTAHN